MATYVQYNNFGERLCRAQHDFGSDVFKVVLSNGIPNPLHTNLPQIPELPTANGYTQGGLVVTMMVSESGGLTVVNAIDPPKWTATGPGFTYRYAALYNVDSTDPVDALVSYWDNGFSTTVTAGNDLQVDFGANLFKLNFSPAT